jgi:hypothetical protein
MTSLCGDGAHQQRPVSILPCLFLGLLSACHTREGNLAGHTVRLLSIDWHDAGCMLPCLCPAARQDLLLLSRLTRS